MSDINPDTKILKQYNYKSFFIDLVIYISVMFLVREIRIPNAGFITNGLINSFTTLVVASLIMRVRGVTWKELGLTNPKSLKTTLMVTGFILVFTPVSIMIFELIKDQLPFFIAPDTSGDVTRWDPLKGNLTLFFSIIFFVWIESFLEELLDRGFLMNWFERLFSKTSFATILAVVFQAAIFGFRHSYDLSERSITVGLIGLIMGIAYMAFGRNLWPLIIAHCILNTMSMLERVF